MSIPPADIHCQHISGGNNPTQRVILFGGHMVDAPDRPTPRLPPDKIPAASRAIENALNQLEAGPADLAFTQGACGGDILFAEACLDRSVTLYLLQPFEQDDFIRHSVMPGGSLWLQRYQAVTARLPSVPLGAPTALGELPAGMNAYERCNLWLLETALAYGNDNVLFICLWDGGSGNGPGGTAHMVSEVKKHLGQVLWLDTRRL